MNGMDFFHSAHIKWASLWITNEIETDFQLFKSRFGRRKIIPAAWHSHLRSLSQRIMAHPHPMKRTNFLFFSLCWAESAGEKITHKEGESEKRCEIK